MLKIRSLKCRWLQFSLRSLLLFLLMVSVGLGWFVERVRRQRAALAKIVGYGGQVTYDYQLDQYGSIRSDSFGNALHGLEPPGPRWLRKFLGDDYFRSPVKVWLEVDEGVGYHDDELAALAESLRSLPTLKALSLRGSPITDGGLAHLRGLSQLEEFNCMWTSVTDSGVDALQRDLPNCHITR